MNSEPGGAAPPIEMDTKAFSTASPNKPFAPSKRGLKAADLLRLGFLAVAVIAAFWGIEHNPWLRERRLSAMSLGALQREIKAQPSDPDALYYTGFRLDQRGQFLQAAPLLQRAAELAPEESRIRAEWMRALLGCGRPSEAIEELSQYASMMPESAAAHRLLGEFYVSQHSMLKANSELSQAVRLDPNDREAWVYLADARADVADPQGAIQAEEKAVALNPNKAGDHVYLGTLYARSSRWQDAGKQFQEAIRLDPHLAAGHYQFARWLLDHGSGSADLARAESEAREAVQYDAGDALAQQTLGEALARRGKPAEALPPFEEAARLAIDDPAPARRLRELNTALGREADAASWQREYLARQSFITHRRKLLEAVEVHPNDATVHAKLADLLARHGDAEGSIRQYAVALHAFPDSAPVLEAAAKGLLAGGHADAAAVLARRAAEAVTAEKNANAALRDGLRAARQDQAADATLQPAANAVPHGDQRLAYAAPAEAAYAEAVWIEGHTIGPKHITPRVEELAKRAVDLEPTNTTYLRYLLHIQVARRYSDQAIQTAGRVLAISPSDAYANILLGVLLVERAATKQALDEAETHLRITAPTSTMAATQRYGFGLLALKHHQPKIAVADFKEALRLDPTADVTYYKLALAENALGDTRTAAEYMSQYRARQALKREEADLLGDIAQHPSDSTTYRRAIQFLQRHGQRAQAEAVRMTEQHRLGAAGGSGGHA